MEGPSHLHTAPNIGPNATKLIHPAAKKKNDKIDASKIADCLRCDLQWLARRCSAFRPLSPYIPTAWAASNL